MFMWRRVLVRIDFIGAVVLTVFAPLVLFFRAMFKGTLDQWMVLIDYWRSSSLLMVTVYLLIGERRVAFICGIAARLLIAWTMLRSPSTQDVLFERWRWLVSSYCVIGAVLNIPLFRCVMQRHWSPLCRAYMEPPKEFGSLMHPTVPYTKLGRVGDIGLVSFLVGALLLGVRWLLRHRRGNP
ncbi:MAG: DUF3177 family protein [Chloroflexi bacterium AL-W]|nr:DUF3177 family protein [Chloroflexi bacterium AL-N1]NOK68624.1 DUF3177 family protein [Chloroflexi bacterium AL-N10]NOK76110.1 DUF3177 family protein [Chloroflexi bacterium AL-N5]NOK82583.1 DUF3177 family protein [Chloroflexi bacterium AL-W]NOK93381.1 DUF3177 family protein [Chloroflexi bacterium AL-N15]